ncbi:MAG: 4-hydroxy-3-methylbut-2-enyl diphosphate reductase [Oscillibacter sp.]|nr:4-hydroxy-3-methylbut-2-enyl diphosphate reductase [Oscillibacter sp.]
MEKRILLASPRGFCMGVERAVRMLEEALRREQGTVYVRRELVHNAALMERFQSLGAVVVREVDQVPPGGTVVFSAHGVAPSVRERAGARGLRVVDTTCPLVEKVHREAARLREEGYTILLIGEPGHKEVEGVMGEAPERIRLIPSSGAPCPGCLDGIDGSRVAWLSQTTLHVDETARIVEGLRKRFPLIQGPPKSDICYATKNRQAAVKSIAGECGLFIVVGSKTSSNTRRLAEVAAEAGAGRAIRIDEPEELEDLNFSGVETVGVSSGVSAGEEQLDRVLSDLKKRGYARVEERIAVREKVPAGGL